MKTINIFLASSKELDYSRMAFGNLVRRLDDLYEKRGIRVKLFEWEDYDAAYNNRPKQEEYNDHIRKSDVFVALFFVNANRFTLEEFDVALDEFGKRNAPRIYVYCKDIPEDKVSDGLRSFKKRLEEDLQYYLIRYRNRDSLQFHFVMQFQLLINNRMNDLKVEDGMVTLEGITIAKMDNLKFASENEEYKRMRDELAYLPERIEKISRLVKKYPGEKDLEDDLQRLLDRQNKIKENFAIHQQLLFNTAKHMAQLHGQRITKRMRDAMDALSEGKVHKANVILEDVEDSARLAFDEYKQCKELAEQKRLLVLCSVEELLLKASTLMVDAGNVSEGRMQEVGRIYAQADEMAQECEYDNEKYVTLLFDYYKFLFRFSHSGKVLEVVERLVRQCEEVYGKEHSCTLSSYNNAGNAYLKLGDKSKAQEYFDKAKSS